jgi:hypothetical protein
MKFRLVSICFLVPVLLNGVTGSVLAAVFCPHASGVMTCCSAQKMEQNDDMDGMQMGMQADMQSGAASVSDVQSLGAGSVDVPQESCAHCITHSQPVSTPVFLCGVDQKDHRVGAVAPVAAVQGLIPSTARIYSITARTHAPPGPQNRRYILLNVFRI